MKPVRVCMQNELEPILLDKKIVLVGIESEVA